MPSDESVVSAKVRIYPLPLRVGDEAPTRYGVSTIVENHGPLRGEDGRRYHVCTVLLRRSAIIDGMQVQHITVLFPI